MFVCILLFRYLEDGYMLYIYTSLIVMVTLLVYIRKHRAKPNEMSTMANQLVSSTWRGAGPWNVEKDGQTVDRIGSDRGW